MAASTWCSRCGTIPQPGTRPACMGCRLVLNLPRLGRRSAMSAESLLRNARQGAPHASLKCGAATKSGALCTKDAEHGLPCRWHRDQLTTASPQPTPVSGFLQAAMTGPVEVA